LPNPICSRPSGKTIDAWLRRSPLRAVLDEFGGPSQCQKMVSVTDLFAGLIREIAPAAPRSS
jgi:hypothetical protein